MERQGEREVLFAINDNRRGPQQSPYTEISVKRPGWTKILVLAGVACTIGCSLPVGYNIGVVNTPADIMKIFCNESLHSRYGSVLTTGQLDLLWSCIVSIFLVGGAIGSLCGSLLANKIGRRGALLVSFLLGASAAVLFFSSKAANSVEMVMGGRLLVGLSAGLITCVMPMYLMELAPVHLRGAMGVLCQLGVTFGVLLGQIFSVYHMLGNEDYWPHLLALYAIPLIICAGVFLLILPESPKYLFVIKKEPQLALEQLSRIRNVGQTSLNAEIQELKVEEQDNELNEGDSWNIAKVLTTSELFLPLLLVCSLQAGQQFSGINAVFYYSANIFASAGLSRSSSELATIGTGCCNLFMAIVSVPVMSKFNRRIVIQISLATTALCLVILGLAISYINSFSWMPLICISGVLGFVICYGIGLGPIPFFIGSELFEVGPRPSAMALGSMANWGGNFIVGLCFPTMQSCLGAGSFFIFTVIVVCLFIFIRIYLPETRGKDPSEIAGLCRNGLKSKPVQKNVGDVASVNTETL